MGPSTSIPLVSGRYHDVINSGANLMAPFQCMAFLTSAQVASDATAKIGVAVRPSPAYNNTPDRVLGISEAGAKHGQPIAIRTAGYAQVMAGAAVAFNARLQPGLVEAKTNAQSPLIDLYEANLPVEPGVGVTYNLSMVDDIALTPSTTGSNVLTFPVGWSVEVATAKYQIIRVELDRTPFYL
jgi:hypothetical protein